MKFVLKLLLFNFTVHCMKLCFNRIVRAFLSVPHQIRDNKVQRRFVGHQGPQRQSHSIWIFS